MNVQVVKRLQTTGSLGLYSFNHNTMTNDDMTNIINVYSMSRPNNINPLFTILLNVVSVINNV